MNKALAPATAIAVLVLLVFAGACTHKGKPGKKGPITSGGIPVPKRSSSEYGFYRTISVQRDMIPYGYYGRFPGRRMSPRYITIHSTANVGATAQNHADALRNGKLTTSRHGLNRVGFLTWHFTVDDVSAIQHLPTNEQGEHADYSGPGNLYSIGVEICEFRSSKQQAAAVDRAAKLAAWLMVYHDLPLSRVVPHYHWPRYPNNWHKPCPRIFMTKGQPGPKWDAFKQQVARYHRMLTDDTRLADAGKAPRVPSGNPVVLAAASTSPLVPAF